MDVDSACHLLSSGAEAAPIYRRSLCVAGEAFGKSLQDGDAEFAPTLEKLFKRCESDAAEQLVLIKQALKSPSLKSSLEDVLEPLAILTRAQCAFIGSGNDIVAHEDDWITKCYYNDESGNKGFLRENKNLAIITACRHMRHGKVFLVPENLQLSAMFDGVLLVAEALMAIPLFFGDRLVGHMGLMWTSHGLRTQSLSWSYLEMVLHSLEDLIAQRVAEEAILELPEPLASKQTDSPLHHAKTPRQIASAPASPVFAHPLKPFAPSLSHELRTPMQGVVGMLDVMHANVEEAIHARIVTKSLRLLQDLKENIELVQDSARRAVEAADNVVHAYDLNMEIPETPQKELYADIMGDALSRTVGSCDRFSLKENSFPNNPYKRRRSVSLDWTTHGRPAKRISRRNTAQDDVSPLSEVKNAVHESDKLVHSSGDRHIEEVVGQAVSHRPSLSTRRMAPQMVVEGVPPTAVRQTKIRELLHLIINESLHVGKRPEFTRSQQTSLGERIDVHALASNGDTCIKSIEWSVESKVPEYLYVDERDLAKLISCVFLNAVKFTESGEIRIMATSSDKTPHYIRINIRDTGTGIPQEFFPNLFKPFAREDDSTTRTRDGLGLGLLVAKGLARKMGGDLLCVRSSTTGPERGSEFEIRVPLYPGGTLNRPTTSQASPLDTSSPNIDANASSDNITDPATDSKIIKASLPLAGLEMLPPAVTVHNPDQPIRRSSITIPSTALHGTGLGQTHPLTFLVAEDNQINRKILVNMLRKLGYIDVYEAYDGREAVRIMQESLLSSYPLPSPMSSPSMQGSDNGIDQDLSISDTANPGNRKKSKPIDVVLMDLWMPEMDGYEATSKIFEMVDEHCNRLAPMQALEQSLAENWDRSSGSMSPSLADISPKVLAVSADVTDEALNRASQVGIQGYMTKPYKLADLERLIVDCCLPQM